MKCPLKPFTAEELKEIYIAASCESNLETFPHLGSKLRALLESRWQDTAKKVFESRIEELEAENQKLADENESVHESACALEAENARLIRERHEFQLSAGHYMAALAEAEKALDKAAKEFQGAAIMFGRMQFRSEKQTELDAEWADKQASQVLEVLVKIRDKNLEVGHKVKKSDFKGGI